MSGGGKGKVTLPAGYAGKTIPSTRNVSKRISTQTSKASSRNNISKGLSRTNVYSRLVEGLIDDDPDYDDDETEPPDDSEFQNMVDEIHSPERTAFERTTSSKGRTKGRGQYKGLNIDSKTQGGRVKIIVMMADGMERAVGDNARDLVNFCGYVVRTMAPVDKFKWKQVFEAAGEQMWNMIKERFECPNNEERLKSFCEETMQRLFKAWKNRLYAHYKNFSNDDERRENLPKDLGQEQWKHCMEYFGSESFKKTSERNSMNAKKRKQMHTTGNVSFAEHEHKLVDKNGNKPSQDEIWYMQHSRMTVEGNTEWADDRSKEIGEKLQDLVNKSRQEGAVSMTKEQMYDDAMGTRSGFRRGFGYGKKGATKGVRACEILKQQHQQEVAELKGSVVKYQQEVVELKEQIQTEHANQAERDQKLREEITKEIQEQIQRQFQFMSFPSFQFTPTPTSQTPSENN